MKDILVERHKKLLYREPTPEQLSLYGAAPQKRGFASTRFLTPEQAASLFEAVFVYALSQTFVAKDNEEPNAVYLFIDPALENWVIGQVQAVVRHIFSLCKQQENGVRKARHLGQLIKKVMVGSRLPAGSPPPDHWAVFGIDPNPKLPIWLRDAIIPVYPTDRE